MATGGDDGAVRLFTADTGHSDGAPLTGHGKRVGSVAFSLDGQILASASDDGAVVERQ